MRLAKGSSLTVSGEGILLPILSTNATLLSEFIFNSGSHVLNREPVCNPFCRSFCGNLVLTKANFSPQNAKVLLKTMQLRTSKIWAGNFELQKFEQPKKYVKIFKRRQFLSSIFCIFSFCKFVFVCLCFVCLLCCLLIFLSAFIFVCLSFFRVFLSFWGIISISMCVYFFHFLFHWFSDISMNEGPLTVVQPLLRGPQGLKQLAYFL